MIVQVSPLPASRSESVCSLQFASRARRAELGKASARQDVGAEVAKAKAEAKKALDGQRAAIAELSAAKTAASAAAEAEAAARSRANELASREYQHSSAMPPALLQTLRELEVSARSFAG